MANEVLYLDPAAAQSYMAKIRAAAGELQSSAKSFSASVQGLTTEAWRGDASNDIWQQYLAEYKDLIETKIPTALENFDKFMTNCANGIKETDQRIAK